MRRSLFRIKRFNIKDDRSQVAGASPLFRSHGRDARATLEFLALKEITPEPSAPG